MNCNFADNKGVVKQRSLILRRSRVARVIDGLRIRLKITLLSIHLRLRQSPSTEHPVL